MSQPTEQEYLINLGLWARDKVLPLLRKIPPATKILLPNPDPKKTKPIESTAEIEIGKVFEACPQKFDPPQSQKFAPPFPQGHSVCEHAVPSFTGCPWCES